MWLAAGFIGLICAVVVVILYVDYKDEVAEFLSERDVGGESISSITQAPTFLEWLKFKVAGK